MLYLCYIILLVLILIVFIIVLGIFFSGWCTRKQCDWITNSMVESLPDGTRRDRLYGKLAYQYAANSLSFYGWQKSIYDTWRPEFANLTRSERSRLYTLGLRASFHGELQAAGFDVLGGRIVYHGTFNNNAQSTARLIEVIWKYDPRNIRSR